MNRAKLVELILDTLRQFDFPNTATHPGNYDENTLLFGSEGLLDSIGLVSFVLDVEESLRSATGQSITLADERAMSQKRSPFRSVASLADYASQLLVQPPDPS